MGRKWVYFATLGQGERAIQVGYSSKPRNGLLAVVFHGPDGERVEKMTTCSKIDGRYHLEVAKLLTTTYAPSFPDPKKVTFDVALAEVVRTAKDLRPKTLEAFEKAVKVLRQTLDADKLTQKITSPIEITDDIANRFGVLWLSGTYKRGKASDAKEYSRSPVTLCHYLRMYLKCAPEVRPAG